MELAIRLRQPAQGYSPLLRNASRYAGRSPAAHRHGLHLLAGVTCHRRPTTSFGTVGRTSLASGAEPGSDGANQGPVSQVLARQNVIAVADLAGPAQENLLAGELYLQRRWRSRCNNFVQLVEL